MAFNHRALTTLSILVFFSGAAWCADTSLYDRLGGNQVIARVVDETIDRTAADPRTGRSFDKVNLKNVKQKVVEQICSLTGGPCKYTGDPMKESHRGLEIREAEFYGMVEHLREALDRAGVEAGAKNELLKILAPMKRDIVTR